jgi:prevent-host-death family protein
MDAKTVGIRELKQNASAVVARVRAGDSLVVTDRGVPVARIIPMGDLSLDDLVASGLAAAPSVSLDTMLDAVPAGPPSTALSDILADLRDDNRS